MLALKAIHLCNKLKNSGYDVLFATDNFKNILMGEWNMLQVLQGNINNSKVKSHSGTINYNAMKISPISILNEIYSSCIDEKFNKRIITNKVEGSLTSIIIT